ncbi:MAG: hypothetical protein AAGL90_05780 [Pseudomonadota bacterium]
MRQDETERFDGTVDYYLPTGRAKTVVRDYALIELQAIDQHLSINDSLYFRLDGTQPIEINNEFYSERCLAVLSEAINTRVSTLGRQRFWVIALSRGAMTRLLRLDARKEQGRFMSWDHIPWVGKLSRELSAAKTPKQLVEISNQAISLAMDRALDVTIVEPALYHLTMESGDLSVSDLADRTSTNRRKLERAFQARLGVSPNLELRKVRFHATLNQFAENPDAKWRDLEFAPYSDQSHFLKEARFFNYKLRQIRAEYAMEALYSRWFPEGVFDEDQAVSSPDQLPALNANFELRLQNLRALAETC